MRSLFFVGGALQCCLRHFANMLSLSLSVILSVAINRLHCQKICYGDSLSKYEGYLYF